MERREAADVVGSADTARRPLWGVPGPGEGRVISEERREGRWLSRAIVSLVSGEN